MCTPLSSIPTKLEGGYRPVKVLDINDLYTDWKHHRRMRVFASKGLKCSYCDAIGIHLIKCLGKHNDVHINVYTKDFKLMTIDHVIPKSKGGTNRLKNLVPSCCECNIKKSDKILDSIPA